MRIKFFCDNGANCQSRREEVFDTEDLGYTAAEWLALSDESKDAEVREWAFDTMEMGWEADKSDGK